MKTKDITLISGLVAILYTQELLLTFLPNVQFSTFLVVLYSKLFSFRKSLLIVILYVTLDNMLFFGFNIYLYLSMLVAWSLVPILLHTIFKKYDKALPLAIFGFIFGFVYSWVLIPASILIMGIPFKAYIISDIWFEIILACSNFLTIYWLFDPLYRRLKLILPK